MVKEISFDHLTFKPTRTPNPKIDPKVIEHAKAWICTMLYTGPKKLDFFVREGCKVMIYDALEYEDLTAILDALVIDQVIMLNSGEYTLSLKGVFEVKKRTIIPLLNITDNPEYARAFIQKNKENCDTIFIEELANIGGAKREPRILEYCKNNYHKIATILALVVKGVAQSSGAPTGQ